MSDDGESPLDPRDEEIASEAAADAESFFALVPHFYRGELAEASAAQARMDRTTNWAITLIAALLSVVFATRTLPAYLLLVGMVVLGVFLSYEVRRYRFYDHYRARVRYVQQNVFANALDPTGVEH